MNKELCIALINKDLQELEILTKGFSEMENFPKTLVDLSVAKAQNIVNCLQKLPLNVVQNQEPRGKNQDNDVRIEEKFVFEESPKEIVVVEIPEEKAKKEIEFSVAVTEELSKIEQKTEIKLEKEPISTIFEQNQKKEFVIDALQKEENTVAQNILKNKISDLKQAFSIADRFRFQRELFDNSGEKLSKSLDDFNAMETLEQAQNYIETTLKLDLQNAVVQDFIEILKRKLN